YLNDQIALAAVNSGSALVVAGPKRALRHVAAELQDSGHRTRWLHVSHAFHSPLMDPALSALSDTAASLTHHRATIPVISATTGQPLTPDTDWPTHWTNHARNTVNFAQTISYLTDHDTATYLEIGPDTHLTPHITAPLAIATQHHGKPETTT